MRRDRKFVSWSQRRFPLGTSGASECLPLPLVGRVLFSYLGRALSDLLGLVSSFTDRPFV